MGLKLQRQKTASECGGLPKKYVWNQLEPIGLAIDGRLARIEGIRLLMQNAFSETTQNADAAVCMMMIWNLFGPDGCEMGLCCLHTIFRLMACSNLEKSKKSIHLPG